MGIFKSLAWLVAEPQAVVEDRPWHNDTLDALLDEVPRLVPAVAVDRAITHLRTLRNRPDDQVQAMSALGDVMAPYLEELRARARGDQGQDTADLLALLGRTLVKQAWLVRGDGTASTVEKAAWPVFGMLLLEADKALVSALEIAPQHAAAATARLTTARGLGEELPERFEVACQARPTLYPAHHQMLLALCAKWGGSDEAMFDFARQTVANAPSGDPVVAVLPLAHAEYLCSIAMKRNSWGGPSAADARRADQDLVLQASLKWCGDGSEPVVPHPYDVEAHNLFGWYLINCREHRERGRWHLARTRLRMTGQPWHYVSNDPKQHFDNLLARHGVVPLT